MKYELKSNKMKKKKTSVSFEWEGVAHWVRQRLVA